jgi:hypothetical protein
MLIRAAQRLGQVLYLHATLKVDEDLPGRLAVGCKVLSRIRNCSFRSTDLDPILDAVLAVLRWRGDTETPQPLSALAQCLCLLHSLCWCSIEASAESSDSSSHGCRPCLALENQAFACRLSEECTPLVCAVLLEHHARLFPCSFSVPLRHASRRSTLQHHIIVRSSSDQSGDLL